VLNPDFAEMLSVLCAEDVDFLLVGAYAMAAHGVPRATGDIDIWVRPSAANARRVIRALRRFGAPLFNLTEDDLTYPGTVFQIGLPPRRIDILTSIDGVDFPYAWRSRVRCRLEGIDVAVLGRRALLRNKRATGRPKDLLDAGILEEAVRSKRGSPKPRRAARRSR
jgi:hypothetical protein